MAIEAEGYYGGGRGYGRSFYNLLQRELNDNVLVILTSGGAYSAVAGILSRVMPDHIVLINGNVILEIPLDRIATVSKLAGGGPVAPAPGSVAGFPAN